MWDTTEDDDFDEEYDDEMEAVWQKRREAQRRRKKEREARRRQEQLYEKDYFSKAGIRSLHLVLLSLATLAILKV